LIVVFDSGLQLTVPNELLVVPEKLIDDSGEVKINSTSAEILIQPTLGDNAADTPLIGKQFFSSTYLFVDHDAGTFTVWQANSTTDTKLVSVGSDCDVIATQETPLAPAPSSSSRPTSEATDPPTTAPDTNEDSASVSTGAIAGIAVGAAGSLAAIAIILYVCFVRRRKRKSHVEKSLLSGDAARDGYYSSPYRGFEARHELENVATSELNAVEHPKELPSGKEASELGCVESKRVYKSPTSSHLVYELASSSP
jgi:hypothetical protein